MKLLTNLKAEYIEMNGEVKSYNQLMAEYIKASEKLRGEISKGKDPFIMLDKSLLCISLMTGDDVFYKVNRKKLIEIICNWKEKR
ncbi:hypothetical protein [Clostridium botulinum]|uniref:hypothetical protein n=1 Tax=Clostridium botulinum TaxID=1491 RepID=UPI001E5099E4|nr:hypothetical protein [Clostridium botulinum]MCD3232425.1 hypothetical protein [Clostridium botulinum C/D]